MPAPVIVVAYDPAWPETFEMLRRKLAAALGDIVIDIHHVGSTSVPGLAAKPTIDIDIVIESTEQLPVAIERLSRAGYTFEGDLGVVGRYAFRPPLEYDVHHHHPYVCPKGSRELARHLAFRDYLRARPQAARAYGALKLNAAERHRNNREAYATAKTGFVEQALQNAGWRDDGVG